MNKLISKTLLIASILILFYVFVFLGHWTSGGICGSPESRIVYAAFILLFVVGYLLVLKRGELNVLEAVTYLLIAIVISIFGVGSLNSARCVPPDSRVIVEVLNYVHENDEQPKSLDDVNIPLLTSLSYNTASDNLEFCFIGKVDYFLGVRISDGEEVCIELSV